MKNVIPFCLIFLISLSSFSLLGKDKTLENKTNPYSIIDTLGFARTFSEPPSFLTPDLNGKTHSLNGYKGKWILLAFWATWCGPCRMELPELETLYNRLKSKNFNIIGISTDQDDSLSIKKFVNELKLNFSILHDKTGEAASLYQASALPSLYLISPDLKLVGVTRGARTWSDESTIKQFEELIKTTSISEKLFREDRTSSDSNSRLNGIVPEKLLPPELEINKQLEVFENETATILVKIHWKGDPNKYVVTVPKISLPNDSVLINGDISSGSIGSDKDPGLYYSYPILFKKVGTYQLGPVTLSFKSIYGGSEQLSRHPGINIEVKKRSHKLIYATSIAVLFLIFIIVFIRKRIAKRRGNDDQLATPKTDWQSNLIKIKNLRIEGKRKEYSVELIQLYIKILDEKKLEIHKFKDLLEKISFAGHTLSDSEFDYFEKEITKEFEGENI